MKRLESVENTRVRPYRHGARLTLVLALACTIGCTANRFPGQPAPPHAIQFHHASVYPPASLTPPTPTPTEVAPAQNLQPLPDPYQAYLRAAALQPLASPSPSDLPPPRATPEHILPPLAPGADQFNYRGVTLGEVLRIAMENSQVLRDLGGRVIQAPGSIATVYDSDLRTLHPRFGVAAALSEFDTQLATNLFWNNADIAANNINSFPNGNVDTGLVEPRVELRKRSLTGGRVFGRVRTQHEDTNSLNARFHSFWNADVEVGFRQPLLRGRGAEYNLIAGATDNQDLLLGNGVWIAQVDSDITALEFEAALADFVSQVESAYWELGFAYQAFIARDNARRVAHEQLSQVLDRQQAGLRGGEAENEAAAREQVFIFEAAYLDSLTGSAAVPGLQVAERRLRRLVGLPPRDGLMLRPLDHPPKAKFVFDDATVVAEATATRPELKQQRLRIERRRMQLVSARNFRLPQLDVVGNYRVQGYGDDLVGHGRAQFDSALGTLSRFSYGEYQVGLEFVMPLGFRQARSGVAHAELQLARESAILIEQERHVADEVIGSLEELSRAQAVAEAQRRRLQATDQTLLAIDDALSANRTTLDVRLAAERRRVEANIAYARALADHAIALKNIEWKRGALPPNAGIHIAGPESPVQMPVELNAPQTARRPPTIGGQQRF